jgi:HEAT repeat protein
MSVRELDLASTWRLGAAVCLLCACASGVEPSSQLQKYRKDLKGANKYTREKTVWLVAREIAPGDAVPLLVDVLLQDGEERVRASAAQALGEIGSPASSAVPALVRATQDKGEMSFVNERAVEALSKIGPAAIPELAEAICGSMAQRSGRRWDWWKRFADAHREARARPMPAGPL